MEIKEQLKLIGLHPAEIRVYLYLLERGVSSPPQIARSTGIARTNAYHILKRLIDKELVREQKHGQRKVYAALDPAALLRSWEKRKDALAELVPDLRAIYNQENNKPTIRFYEGFDQVKEIFKQSLVAQELNGVVSLKKLFSLSPQFFRWFSKQIKKKNIILYDIATFASGEKEARLAKETLRGLYDVKLLPKEYEDVPTNIFLWNENVALITLEEPIFGTVLTNKAIARTFKIMFKELWKGSASPQWTS